MALKGVHGELQQLAVATNIPDKTILVKIKSIEKIGDMFHLGTDEGVLVSKNVIWAAGEYQYPNLAGTTQDT